MVIFNKELRTGTKGFVVWTAVIAMMLAVCVLIYPAMKDQMGQMNQMFANMGSFSEAFGMVQLNFGRLIGFYGVEAGNILGLGGGFFAAYIGITMLSKEERDHTAEFLLSHPVSRASIIGQKLASVFFQIILMNLIIFAFGVVSILAVGESLPLKELLLIHVSFLLLQLEIGSVCFGLSAFLCRGSIGIGLGGAALLYFMNIIINLSEKAEFLKYITPFAYAKPEDIIDGMALDWALVGLGVLYSLLFIALAFIKYGRKDIAA